MNLLKASLLTAIVATTFNVNAETVDLDDVTIEVATEEVKRGHRLGFPGRTAILDYMLENGDITQEQIDARKAEREANKAEIQALKEAGDEEALAAKKAELRAERQERKAEMKSYIEANADLKETLQELKQERKEKRKERRQAKRDAQEETTIE